MGNVCQKQREPIQGPNSNVFLIIHKGSCDIMVKSTFHYDLGTK